jgi:hypothetical protein
MLGCLILKFSLFYVSACNFFRLLNIISFAFVVLCYGMSFDFPGDEEMQERGQKRPLGKLVQKNSPRCRHIQRSQISRNLSRTVSYNFQLKLNYSIYRVIRHGTYVLDEHCEIINVNELIPASELQLPTKT